jgi:5-methyltetrahydrofolate--homocysteine methyltransferase
MLTNTRCYGDAFFHFFPDLGSAVVASFLGPEPRYGSRSILNESSHLGTLEEIEHNIRFDPESCFWQRSLALVRAALELFGDRVVVGFPNLGGALDILASLRGTQNLLMDLVLDPEVVKRVEVKLSRLWIRYYEELYAVFKQLEQQGTASWVGVWATGKMFPIQCDIAVMVSPEMFQEFAVPSLRIQAQALDHCIFHCHGECPKKTLDHLIEMDEIHAVQWSPGGHHPTCDDEAWLPVYRRITERGKGLVLLEVKPENVQWLVSRLPAERLAVNVLCRSGVEAREILSRYGRT